MAPNFFKDLGKAAFDLLNDDFLHAKKINITTTTDNGMEVVVDGEMTEKLSTSKIAAKYENGHGVSLDKMEIKTDGRIGFQGSIAFNENFKLKVDVEDGSHEPGHPIKSHGIISAIHVSPVSAIIGAVDAVNGPTFKGSGVLKSGNLSVGLQLEYDTQWDEKGPPLYSDYNAGLGYKGENWEASIISKNKVMGMDLSFLQTINPQLRFAFNMNCDLSNTSHEISVGSLYKFDKDSTFRTKMDSNAVLSLAFSQNLSPQVNLTLAGEVDTKDWAADSHRFGMALKFNL